MFRFLYKNLNFVVGISPTYKNPSVLSSLGCVSTKENASQLDSFTVSHLINSCGFSSKSALSASKAVLFETPDETDSVLSVLKKYGFSEAEISSIVEKQPKLLVLNPWETVVPKLAFFFSKGFSTSDIVKMSSSTNLFLYSSLADHIVPTFNFLRDFLRSDEKTVTTLSRLLFIPRLECLEPRINLFLDIGLTESRIAYFLCSCPAALTAKFDKLKWTVEKAREKGISPSDARFIEALGALMGISLSTWQSKVDVFKRWGWSEEVFHAAFRRQPSIMRASEKKIMATMDLFVNKLGWESSVLAKYPMLIKLCMKRLTARGSVWQFLVSKGLISRDHRGAHIFLCSETTFLKKFVNCYNEAPELLKLYANHFAK